MQDKERTGNTLSDIERNLDHLETGGMTPMNEVAVQTHEHYLAYKQAGFSERQALWLATADTNFRLFTPPAEDPDSLPPEVRGPGI